MPPEAERGMEKYLKRVEQYNYLVKNLYASFDKIMACEHPIITYKYLHSSIPSHCRPWRRGMEKKRKKKRVEQ